MFSKVDNVRDFLIAFLEVEIFSKKGSTLKGKNLLQLEKFFSLCDDPNYTGGNDENDSFFP